MRARPHARVPIVPGAIAFIDAADIRSELNVPTTLRFNVSENTCNECGVPLRSMVRPLPVAPPAHATRMRYAPRPLATSMACAVSSSERTEPAAL